jgi:NADH dehydrogenase FAD-containing subunit
MSPDAPRVNTTWLVWVAGVRARAHIVKTRESVAKSRKSVNEKNAHLAWRNARTASCG